MRSARSAPPHIVAASLYLYRALLSLHPRAFRRAYGDAIVQVFADECRDAHRAAGAGGVVRLWLPEFGDLLAGAVAEHLALVMGGLKGTTLIRVYRQSASAIFVAFIAFVVAGIGFQKMSETVVKSNLPAAHPLLNIAYIAVEVGAALALLAVLAGGVPIALAALRTGLAQHRGDILWRFAVPPVTLGVLAGYALLLLRHSPDHVLAWTLIGLFLLAAAASTAAVLDAIARGEVDPRLFQFARMPGAVAALAMLLTLAGSATWSLVLWQSAPSIFFGSDGILATSTLLSTIAHTAVMLAAVAIAIRATLRALSAREETGATA